MLIDFYKAVLKSVNLLTDDEGFITVKGSDDRSKIVALDGKTLVLPTREHMKTMFKTEDDGSFEQTKVLYNPLDENVVKGDNRSLVKTKTSAEATLAHAIMANGILLLQLAMEKKLQKNVNLEVSKFLAKLSEIRRANVKELVDDKTISTWSDLCRTAMLADRALVTIFLKKSATYNGIKYIRLATLKCNLYEDILLADENTPVYGRKLRNKDRDTFRLLLEFLLPALDDNNVMSVGTNNSYSPAFVALFTLYTAVATRLNAINKGLSHVDAEVADSGYIDIGYSQEEIDNVEEYAPEVKLIPSENDVSKSVSSSKQQAVVAAQPVISNYGVVSQQPTHPQSMSAEDAFMSKYGRPQQPMMYQPPMQPVVQPPMPMMQQPMYAQPQPKMYPLQGVYPQPSPYGYQHPVQQTPVLSFR